MASAERSCASVSTAGRMFIVQCNDVVSRVGVDVVGSYAIYPDAPRRAILSPGSVLLPSSWFRRTWQYASGPGKPPTPAVQRASSPLRAPCVHRPRRYPEENLEAYRGLPVARSSRRGM